MAEKVKRVGVDKEEGYLYYVDEDGDISRSEMSRKGRKKSTAEKEKVEEAGVDKEEGYLYYVDGDGDISRSEMARGRKSKDDDEEDDDGGWLSI